MRLVVVMAWVLCGCSFIGVNGPRSPTNPAGCDRREPIEAPIIDGVLGGAAIIAGVVLIAISRGDSEGHAAVGTAVALGGVGTGVLGATFAGSAINGTSKIRACRRARELMARRETESREQAEVGAAIKERQRAHEIRQREYEAVGDGR